MTDNYQNWIFTPGPTRAKFVGVLNCKSIVPVQDLELLIPVQPGSYVTRGLVSVSVDPTTMMVSNAMRIRWFLPF